MSLGVYSSAIQMLDALRDKSISSVELTQLHIDRINATDSAINAIAVRNFDRALESAHHSDEQRAKGHSAPLLGLPMTVKESTRVAGMPQSAGIPELKDYVPDQSGRIMESLEASGICLLGKTNIPTALFDWQADSPVYGRTNNPWDRTRTPGGSTGGGAAALAAGMTPLEVGSDIGGSVRIPAAYCGCYGHRPSETAIPKSGAFPFADQPNPAFLLGVQGPLARTAADAALLFDALIGPEPGEGVGWSLNLPAPRHLSLSGMRVAVIKEVAGIRCSDETSARLDELARLLASEGAQVSADSPNIDMQAYYHDYITTLFAMISQGQPRELRENQAQDLLKLADAVAESQAKGLTLDTCDYLALVGRRAEYRLAWQAFFESYDVVITPMTLDSAFEHKTQGDMNSRWLEVDGVKRPYFSNVAFSMLAILAGLPATAIPAGLDAKGLPIGLQVIGPYLEDRTTLACAALLEKSWYGFQVPKASF